MSRKLVKDMTTEELRIRREEMELKKQMTPAELAQYKKIKQRNWTEDYLKSAYDTVNFRTPKGGNDLIKAAAKASGMSKNDFLRKAVSAGMEQLGFSFDPDLLFPPACREEGFAK